jgi:hypothetical protein
MAATENGGQSALDNLAVADDHLCDFRAQRFVGPAERVNLLFGIHIGLVSGSLLSVPGTKARQFLGLVSGPGQAGLGGS